MLAGVEPVDCPDVAKAVGAAIIAGAGRHAHRPQRRWRLRGRQQSAGVRAAICHDSCCAHQGVEHDNMIVLVLGGRILGQALAGDLVRAFVGARDTADEQQVRRFTKLAALEQRYRRTPA